MVDLVPGRRKADASIIIAEGIDARNFQRTAGNVSDTIRHYDHVVLR